MNQLRPGSRPSAAMGVLSRSGLSLNKIVIRIISNGQMLFLVVFSEKLGISSCILLRTKGQLVTRGNPRAYAGLALPPYTLITHSAKRRQLVELFCETIIVLLRLSRGRNDIESETLDPDSVDPCLKTSLY
ncbi:hypothetical protein TNCV_1023971 [Trichonephila clavipes]|nr:hypothetical protein TNCV_1023971 [Trichonephila clavipes]